MRRAASSLSRSSAAVGRLGRAAVVAVAVAALGGLGVAVSESTRTARAAPYRVLLASNRDGLFRGYSVRSDGSGLAPLLPRSRALAPVTVSGDGRTVAYVDPRKGHASGIYASRADGTDLRRVVAPRAGAPALSHDGRYLAFSKPGSPGIWIVGTDGRGARRLTRRADEGAQWSPDGKALVFLRSVGDYTQAIVVQPLRGTRRVIGYGDVYGLAWSPDGRWIAYSREEGDNLETPLWLVRPDGTGPRRVARAAGAFAWSPDGRPLALGSGRCLVVVGVDGRGQRIALHGLSPEGVIWLPGSRWLALAAGFPQQIWIVRSDGNGLRRVTAAGANQLVGWTRMTPALPPAQPLPATERIVRSNVLALRARVTSAA